MLVVHVHEGSDEAFKAATVADMMATPRMSVRYGSVFSDDGGW